MTDSLLSALETLRTKRSELKEELALVDRAIDALTALNTTPKKEALAETTASTFGTTTARPSVRTMLVSLLDESDKDWSTAEIIDEYRRRGTPVHGSQPDNALRAAMVDAQKANQIERVAPGRYRSTKFRPFSSTEREPLPYPSKEVHRT